jgi:hypothetical protein
VPWDFPRVSLGRYRIKVLVSFPTATPNLPGDQSAAATTPPSPRKTAI